MGLLNRCRFSNDDGDCVVHPFEVIYSRALPAQSWVNMVVFRPENNRRKWPIGIRCIATSSSFQGTSPTTEKVLPDKNSEVIRGPSSDPKVVMYKVTKYRCAKAFKKGL